MLGALGFLGAVLLAAACSDRPGSAEAPPPPPPAVPVGVATAERKPVPVALVAVGNVQAYTTVSVKAQIAGQIMQVHFK